MRRHARRVLTSVPDVPDTPSRYVDIMSLLDSFPPRVREALHTCTYGYDLSDIPKIARTLSEGGELVVLERIKRIDAAERVKIEHQYNTMVIDILRNKKPR